MAETNDQVLARLSAERDAQYGGGGGLSPSTPSTTTQSGWLSALGQSLGVVGSIVQSNQQAEARSDLQKQQLKIEQAKAAQASATQPLVIGIVAVVVAIFLFGVLLFIRKGR